MVEGVLLPRRPPYVGPTALRRDRLFRRPVGWPDRHGRGFTCDPHSCPGVRRSSVRGRCTDLLYASITKAVGTAVHGANRTVQWRIVAPLAMGSVPATAITLVAMSYFDLNSRAPPGSFPLFSA